jgi:hypothetical protein
MSRWKRPAFPPLDFGSDPDDAERAERLREFPILNAGLWGDDGPIMVIDGIGHDEQRLLAYATCDDAHGGWWVDPTDTLVHAVLDITQTSFAWTPQVKHCETYGGGSFCDSEGEWHRHLVPSPDGVPLTTISLVAWARDVDGPLTYEQWWTLKHPDIPFRRTS